MFHNADAVSNSKSKGKIIINTTLEPNPDLNITSFHLSKDILKDLVIVGEVKNNSPTDEQKFVEIIITAYGMENNILATSNSFTEPTDLQPGQAAPFRATISSDEIGGDIKTITSLKMSLSSQQ